MKIILGLVIAFAVGAACRAFGVPAPSPTSLIGVLLVGCMTLGYLVVDRVQTGRSPTSAAGAHDVRGAQHGDAQHHGDATSGDASAR